MISLSYSTWPSWIPRAFVYIKESQLSMFTEGSNDEQKFPFNSNFDLILSSEVNTAFNPILLLTLVCTNETREKTVLQQHYLLLNYGTQF